MIHAPTLDEPPAPVATQPRAVRRTVLVAATLAVVGVIAVASVVLGVHAVNLTDLVDGLMGRDESLGAAAVSKRLPRTVLALVVGASLGLAGTVMQGVTRNPLADPAMLGLTNGASLAVVCGVAFFSLASPTAYLWVAIAGSGLTAVFVYAIASLGRGGATPLKLALAGAATASAFGCLIGAVLLPRVDVMAEFRFWQVGGVGGGTWERIGLMAPFLLVGLLLSLGSARGLNSLALGDDLAAGLGQKVVRTRLLAGLGAIILCGAATASAGPIGFIGLVVPHVCRLIVGVDHRWLLPSSALVGAGLLTGADVIGRLVARPDEIEVGIVTAVLGAPFFIWLVRRTKVGSR